jgi:hypothetical protein
MRSLKGTWDVPYFVLHIFKALNGHGLEHQFEDGEQVFQKSWIFHHWSKDKIGIVYA